MEGNAEPVFKKRPKPQYKEKGGNKKGKLDTDASDTVYRILCNSRNIGSVIGKGGNIVKALREETQAKITVSDSVPGADERVIIISSPSTKTHRKHKSDEDQDLAAEEEEDPMELHCAAQDALLKVHDKIVEEELVGGRDDEDDSESVVTARLLVPNNTVGCLLGRKGDVIQRLRSDTGASIRVQPEEHLPTCAMSTDELVQISGKPAVAKRALYEVSTLLHQNPRKEKPLSNISLPFGSQGFHPPGGPMGNSPPENPLWSQRHSNSRAMPPMPHMGGYRDQSFGFVLGDLHGGPPIGGDAPREFFMKILCSNRENWWCHWQGRRQCQTVTAGDRS